MLNSCCDQMRSKGRDHYKGVPESDLPDALVELHPAVGAAMMLTPSGRFDCFIQYCPWCGAHIGKEPHELPKGFNPFE